MSEHKSLVPIWVRAAVGLLALANLAYGLMGYLKPASMFPALELVNPGALDAVHQFAARNTAIGLALCIVALVGVPETIAILMIIRFLIEGQDLVLLILNDASMTSLAMPAGFMVLEAAIAVLMFRIVANRDASAARL